MMSQCVTSRHHFLKDVEGCLNDGYVGGGVARVVCLLAFW